MLFRLTVGLVQLEMADTTMLSSANQKLTSFFFKKYFTFREILYVEKPPETAENRLKPLERTFKWLKAILSG